MSKTNITLVFCIVIISTLSYAMELVPLKSQQKKKDFQIHCMQDIPKLSLKDIRPCFEILPERERNKLLIPLAESLTFNIALLEGEDIKLHILTFMLDGDEKSAQLFNATPLWYAHQFYQNLHKKLEYSPAIQQHAGLLFKLPKKTRKQLIEIASTQPTFIVEWIDNSTVFINKKQKRELKQGNEEIKEKISADTTIRLLKDQIAEKYKWNNFRLFVGLLVTTILPIGVVLDKIHSKWLLDRKRVSLYNVINDTDSKILVDNVLLRNCHVEYGKLICHEETPIMETIQSCAYFCAFSFMRLTILKIYLERNILEECPIIKI
jgi:hypothetical protein